VRGPRFKPRSGQKFGSRFLLHARPYSTSGTTSQCIPEPVPSLELTSSEEERFERMGADTLVVKKKREIQWHRNKKIRPENTKTPTPWKKDEGKALDTNGLPRD